MIIALSKKKRLQVYEKYKGHCAYCGGELDYKDMQVDQIQNGYLNNENDLSSYIPACRQCYINKGVFSLEEYRDNLVLEASLVKQYLFRVKIKYGILVEHVDTIMFYKKEPVVFYFERWEYKFKLKKVEVA